MAELVAGPKTWLDSFSNFLAGFGLFGRDKSVSQHYILNILTPQQLEAAYRGDWLARKIIEVPAFDCTRAWRSWVAEQDQIEQLERTEHEFGLQHKLLSGLTKARLYGGAALVIGVDQGNWEEKLDVDKVGKGDLKFVHVVDRWHLAAGPLVRDISSAYFGEPQWYMRANLPLPQQIGNVEQLEATMKGLPPGSAVYIHPSRIVRILGCEYPSMEYAPDPWGDSVLQVVDRAVKTPAWPPPRCPRRSAS
jgi:phage-related protein (TIGR01555 family)